MLYVCIKQTPDSASVYVDPVSGHVDSERFVRVLNPADACAVEAAIRLREQFGGEITVLTLGPPDADGALRAALAMGADRAVRLWHPKAEKWDAFTVAAALGSYITRREQPELILCGIASSDWGSGIVGPALAELLTLPQVTGVIQLQAQQKEGQLHLQLTRRLERGYREVLAAEAPLLITISADLNEPRYPSLPAHVAALQTQIPIVEPILDSQGQFDADLLEISTPRPRPHHIAAPISQHSAFQRIGEIVAGGATGRQTRLVEGSPAELARVLITFLKEKGIVQEQTKEP